jgi:dTDP-4-amino-4,6-dideoxygalactose transaminase
MNKRIYLSPPHMEGCELEFIKQAFESNYIAPLGPMVDSFEEAFAAKVGISHALALSSGTAAIHLALRVLNIGPKDEVFVSTLTFIGSVTPVVFQGARPVFIDSDDSSWNMDPELLEGELARCKELGRLPKAVIPTDLYGQCANMERILTICDYFGVPVISDAAESLGATAGDRHAGFGAKAAAFSFNGNKIITTSGGGMLVSDDIEFIQQARYLAQQAKDELPFYQHSCIGYNYRMSNILAAIGQGQLECLDDRIKRKREIFDYYRKALGDLPGITFMPEASYGSCSRWLTVLLIDPDTFGADSEAVRLALEKENIESRLVWKPMHQQPVFKIYGQADKDEQRVQSLSSWPARAVGGSVADELFKKGLCLPSGTSITDRELERIIRIVSRVAGMNKTKRVA